jgi:hypothetical protein
MTADSFSRRSLVVAVAAMIIGGVCDSKAFDESKYPDWKGQWVRAEEGLPRYDPSKSIGQQDAPLTDEYRAIHEANMDDQDAGGTGSDPVYNCVPPGMPRVMNLNGPMEVVVTPKTTHMFIQYVHDSRRIFTDGRPWPQDVEPSFTGYSIGRWIDTNGDGRYDTLEVETRGFRGPRVYDASGLPLHEDNESVITERIFSDPNDGNVLVDEITTTDNALTKPWRATKRYRRVDAKNAVWFESVCARDNPHIEIGKQNYFLSADHIIMPAKKNQEPPDLMYFRPAPSQSRP